jgi:hypothetical protein
VTRRCEVRLRRRARLRAISPKTSKTSALDAVTENVQVRESAQAIHGVK